MERKMNNRSRPTDKPYTGVSKHKFKIAMINMSNEIKEKVSKMDEKIIFFSKELEYILKR